MKKGKYNCMELLALYCAERSVEKSIPILVHKVTKPKNLDVMVDVLRKEKYKR